MGHLNLGRAWRRKINPLNDVAYACGLSSPQDSIQARQNALFTAQIYLLVFYYVLKVVK